MVMRGRPVGRWFGREDGEIMRAHEFITEYRSVEVGRVLDLTLTKNYPDYSVLDGKILDVSPKGKYKIKIVAAEVIPGRKAAVKVGDTVAIDSYFLKQSLKESVLEEDWKKTLGAIGVAGALAAGGQKTMQPTTPPEARPAVAFTVAPAENPDVNILAQTMWGEARSHGANGMLAVGNVIKNRAEANMKMFGQGIRGVALKPKQFSCWNEGDPNRDRIEEILEYDRLISLRQSPDGTPFDEWFDEFENSGDYMDYKAWLLAKDIAKKIISGRASDPTNGAVYYHTTDVDPSWNAKLDHVATVGNHVFYTLPENLSEYKVDNVEGLGSVPYNQNVDYFGLRVMMKPSTFLSLALPLNEPRSVEYIMQHMKDGGALGAPFLYVKIPADWEEGDLMRPASISGHEGRNRMLAIQKLEGDDPVEVHLLLQGGMRARHLNPDMIKELQNGMMNQSRNRYVTGPLFSK